MNRTAWLCAPLTLALVLSAPLRAQQDPAQPVDVGLEEKVQVTLVQVEAVVMDKDGKTVPNLTKDDFTMKIGGVPVKVSTVDLVCPIGAAEDAAPVNLALNQAIPPIAPGMKRRVVFAFDYSFLDVTMRPRVLDAAAQMLRRSKTDEEEVMVVALTSEVRVEQKFTKDIRQLVGTLARMKHDVTLWSREFPVDTAARGYLGNMATLMDVLGGYAGPKAVVLFSQANTVGVSTPPTYYDEVAAHAAAARAAIYPAKPDSVDAGGAGDSLVRFANQTGGRMQFLGNDISLPYRRAQRDLSCRYTVSARIDAAESREPRKLSVALNKPELSVRTPEMVQIFSDEARDRARAGAAYVDPGPYERPLVRATGFAVVPDSPGKWSTLLAVNFPAPVGATGADINVNAVARQNNQAVGDFKKLIHVDPAPDGAAWRNVTVLGYTKLKDGRYDLTVVLTDAKGGEIVTAQTGFSVPQVLENLLMVRGPFIGRVVPGGEIQHVNVKIPTENTRLGKALGPDNGFQPLLVQEIDPQDKLLFYWSACVYGTNPVGDGALVTRTIVNSKGEVAKAFDPLPLKLESRRNDISCLDRLESLSADTLASGDYRLDVTVTQPNGEVVGRGTGPLTVR